MKRSKPDPDIQGWEFRKAIIASHDDLALLGMLSRRGWIVVCALSPTVVLLKRDPAWIDP